jgi:TolA-binding protein
MNRLLSIGAAMASLALAVPASAQLQSREAIALQDQILQLQHDIQALQAQQQGTPGPQGYYAQPPGYAQGASSDIVSQLLTRVNNLEEEVRQLRGRVDDLQNNLQQSTADLNKQFDDLRFQLQNPGASTSAGAPPPRPVTRPAQEAAVVPSPPPPRSAGALETGDAAFQRGDYATAAKEAQQVLNRRASSNAYDAQFLLAQSYAGMHDWSRAAIAYDDAYNRAPKGSHAEPALLGLAISLTAINERRAACETITKLHSQFPHPSPRLIPQINGVAARAGCA